MTGACFRVAALTLVLASATGTPAVASGYTTERIELAGQPADIFAIADVAQNISMSVPFRIMTRPDGSAWPPYYGTWGIAAGTVARGVTVHGVSGQPSFESPPNTAVYIGSSGRDPGVYYAASGVIRISSSAPAGLAVVQLYSIADEVITKFRPIGTLNIYIQSGSSHPPTAFRMSTTSANVSSSWATIDSPYTNGNPNARVLVTHNWGSSCGPDTNGNPYASVVTRNSGYPCGSLYSNHPLGVWYTGSKWAVFNQDKAPMPVGTFFNVMVEGDEEVDGKIHLASSSNTVYGTTYVWWEALNANPEALLFLTPNWNPGQPVSGSGGYLNHNLAVAYNGSRTWPNSFTGRYNLGMNDIMIMDGASVPIGSAFNTKAIGSGDGSSAFLHVVSASNMPSTTSDYSWITPAITDPNAVIIVSPRADTGPFWMNHPVGVWYDGSRWAIFNEDITPMHVGNAYNVLVPRLPEIH